MTPKRTSVAERHSATSAAAASAAPVIHVVIVTMDAHLAAATERARLQLRRAIPNLQLTLHAAADFANDAQALARCQADLAKANLIVVTMLFMEEHFQPILATLQARRLSCDALICAMSASEVTKLTRMGKFDMDVPASGLLAMLKKLRGKPAGDNKGGASASAGARQMTVLRRLPKILRFIPGTAQDVRAYFLSLQYWLAGSDQNIANMVQFLVDRYADASRRPSRSLPAAASPIEYPDVGLYHPRLAERLTEKLAELQSIQSGTASPQGTVGVLVLRSYLLAGNTAHYDGVIHALEAKGLRVVPCFAHGLDARPAIEKYFLSQGEVQVDAVVSLTGFSLVGGPAYNDARAAEEVLAKIDVPYLAVAPLEFQTLDQWGGSERGMLPVESTIMVAIPELDGATGSMVFGGRGNSTHKQCTGCSRLCKFESDHSGHNMHVCSERAEMLAARIAKLVALRRSQRAERRIALVIFNFPPNAGATGTAAFLSVFESLFNTLKAMHAQGYQVELPGSVEELRERILHGNAARYGALANVHARIAANDHVRREKWLQPIEATWGPAPGKLQSDGTHLHVLGERFGNVFVGVQPAFGHEGDPMRLLFAKSFAPTHAFAAFYRWLREDFAAHAVLHFGTHGALEFMPGKQNGMTGDCWPDRLIADLPNFYLYASNNSSEGTIAKRRAAATLISYLTPPTTQSGLHKELADIKAQIDRWRSLEPESQQERHDLLVMIQNAAVVIDLARPEPAWTTLSQQDAEQQMLALTDQIREWEYTLIPHGMHVVGKPCSPAEQTHMLKSMAEASHGLSLSIEVIDALLAGMPSKQIVQDHQLAPEAVSVLDSLRQSATWLSADHELDGILRALDARFIRPAPGGDLLRTPEILPTGRNLHGFDPFRIPSAFAVKDGTRQAQRLLDRYQVDGHALPSSIAMVLWGTDNLKTEGAPIAQALALLGAKPRFDGYGRLAGAELIPLAELGRPRIDVMITLSGIFRDLLPLQVKLLAEAAYLAASADEPSALNHVRAHALAYQAQHGVDLETAALRVFGNAEGAYGANVNMMIENSRWQEADELAETYARRKGFAYGRNGRPTQQAQLLSSVLAGVQLAYQNLDSVELGVTTIDTYFDTLGGISRAIQRAKGPDAAVAPVYIGDQTNDSMGGGTVRTLTEQVALETHTRMLNPKWYEGMLEHGYEGVRQIEAHLTNTMGWSATTGQVQPWVYQKLTDTFVLNAEMRERLAKLNPTACAKVAHRLIEAHERNYWQPDADTLAALRRAGEDLEDRVEGVFAGAAA